jgi:hypothetical protein
MHEISSVIDSWAEALYGDQEVGWIRQNHDGSAATIKKAHATGTVTFPNLKKTRCVRNQDFSTGEMDGEEGGFFWLLEVFVREVITNYR